MASKKDYPRSDRIAALLQRELAQLIQQELKDPRLPKLTTITAVSVSTDLSHAKIYFTTFSENQDQELVERLLNGEANHLRVLLGKIIVLKKMPQLRFIYDESIEHARHLINLMDKS